MIVTVNNLVNGKVKEEELSFNYNSATDSVELLIGNKLVSILSKDLEIISNITEMERDNDIDREYEEYYGDVTCEECGGSCGAD